MVIEGALGPSENNLGDSLRKGEPAYHVYMALVLITTQIESESHSGLTNPGGLCQLPFPSMALTMYGTIMVLIT